MKRLITLVTVLLFAIGLSVAAMPVPAYAAESSMTVDLNSIFVDVNQTVHFTTAYSDAGPTIQASAYMTHVDDGIGFDSTGFNCDDATHCSFQVHSIPVGVDFVRFVVTQSSAGASNFKRWNSQPIPASYIDVTLPRPTVLLGSSGFDNPENIFQNDGLLATKTADVGSLTIGAGMRNPRIVGATPTFNWRGRPWRTCRPRSPTTG